MRQVLHFLTLNPLTVLLGEKPIDPLVWEYEDSYPGMTDFARAKLDYVEKHPQIMETRDAGTMRYEWDLFSSGLPGSSVLSTSSERYKPEGLFSTNSRGLLTSRS